MEICQSKYIFLQELGKGKTAIVYKGQSEAGEYVAIKESIKNRYQAQNNEQLQNEAQILSQLENSNIISLKEFVYNEDNMILVQELAQNGDLYEYVEKSGRFNEEMARTLFHQLIDGISYCHQKCIAHLDIKPENILLDKNFCLKIADFGVAAKPDIDGFNRSFQGTKTYIAPEVLEKVSYKSELVDVFACGVVLFIIYMGAFPFNDALQTDKRYKYIINNQFEKFWATHTYKEQISPLFKELINGMLTYYPNERFTINDIKNHLWFQGNTLSQDIMIYDFNIRKQEINLNK